MPKRSDAERNLTNEASALRFIASIVALGTTISTLMLTSYSEADQPKPLTSMAQCFDVESW